MLIFWSIASLLVVLTLALLLWPLLRARSDSAAPDADSAAIAVYRDQKQALDAECADGAITPEERDAAVAELARRLGDELAVPDAATPGGRGQRRAWRVALALLVLIPCAAALLYAHLGNPGAVVVARNEGGSPHDVSESQMRAMVDNLAQRLKSHPEDGDGWLLLARSYAALGRYAESADAYAHADALIPDNAALLADYADVLAMSQGARIAGKPAELVRRALAIDPQQRKALALAATAAMEAHDVDAALSYWRRLLAQVPEGSDNAKQINAIIAELESPDRAAPRVAGAAPPAPRSANPPATAPSSGISGRIDIAPDLAAKVSLTDTVFIFARAVNGPRMPLAALRVAARELPKEFRLDDSMGMAPGVKLSTAGPVIVEARISKSGNAIPQPGDLSGKSTPVKAGATGVSVTIDQVVP